MSREAVVEAIRNASRITAICHENPDADTLGSALALRIAAERLGKQAEVVAADPVPPSLVELPGAGEVRTTPQLEPDVAVVLDGPLARTGAVVTAAAEWLSRARIVNIDHHVSNDGDGTVAAWIDPQAAATCEMVALLIPELGVEIDAEIASVLTAGMVQDTHTFSHPNTTPRTLRVAADLVEAGAAAGGDPSLDLRRQALQHPRPVGGDAGRCGAAPGWADRVRGDDDRHAREDRHRSGRIRGIHRPARLHQGCRHHGPVQGGRRHAHAGQRSHLGAGRCRGHHLRIWRRWSRSRRRLLDRCAADARRWRSCSRSASASSIGPMLGVVNLDKPVGPTSHDMVGMMRRLSGTRRIGHAGTLDPLASGVLPILVGGATRFSAELTGGSKRYDAVIRLGARSATDDAEGPIVAIDAPLPDEATAREALASFVGTFDQLPPTFSARKVGGRTAHRAARAGDPIAVPPRLGHDPFPGAARLRPR